MLFYDKKTTASTPPTPITISDAPLEEVSYTANSIRTNHE